MRLSRLLSAALLLAVSTTFSLAQSSGLDAFGTNGPAVAPAPAPASTVAPTPAPSPAPLEPPPPPVDPILTKLQEAFQALAQQKMDVALQKVNEAIQMDPKRMDGYLLRGNIYTQKKQWSDAEKDYQTALQITPNSVLAKFNMAEVKFMQKQYDLARAGFASITSDSDYGDLAAYKVFLCDLFGGHEDVASKELDTFNQVGGNASYYFGNVAWALYHKKPDEARDWLGSATRIYAAKKLILYSTSLRDLGYLPIPGAPPAQ